MENSTSKTASFQLSPEAKLTFNKLKESIFKKTKEMLSNMQFGKIKILIGILLITLAAIYMMNDYLKVRREQLSSLQNKNGTIIQKLNQINDQLESLSSNPRNSKDQQIKLEKIENNIAALQKELMDIAKVTDIQKVSTQLDSVKEDVDSQMSDLKKAVSEGLGNKQYLEPDALPFHVISVDVIGGQPYVSVNYADHVSPLGITDSLVGWRLIAADFDSHAAEFVNDKNQFVKISLQG
jgi:hypothetical protein